MADPHPPQVRRTYRLIQFLDGVTGTVETGLYEVFRVDHRLWAYAEEPIVKGETVADCFKKWREMGRAFRATVTTPSEYYGKRADIPGLLQQGGDPE